MNLDCIEKKNCVWHVCLKLQILKFILPLIMVLPNKKTPCFDACEISNEQIDTILI